MAVVLVSKSKPNSNGAGRKIRLHGHVVTKEELHKKVLEFIHEGITGTTALGKKIGKEPRQTKRILDEMDFLGIISLDPITNRLPKHQKQKEADFDARLLDDKFKQIPVIASFIEKARKRNVKKGSIVAYVSALKAVFTNTKTNPASVLISRDSAEEFFQNYVLFCDEKYPKVKGAPQGQRVAYRIFLASVGKMAYGHGMASEFGFGSHHQSFQKFKKAHIPLKVCRKIMQMMLDDGEILLYTWFYVGIMTGARSSGIASMTWDRVNLFEDDFRLEQHEVKDDTAGHSHLGLLGEWKEKHPPQELYKVLLDWKNNHAPKNSKFVWFEDGKSEVTNRSRCGTVRKEVTPKLSQYLERVRDELSAITQEYIFESGEAGHINRHTFCQMLRNGGASTSEIAYAVGMTEQTVSWYCDISEDEKNKSKKIVSNAFRSSES